MSDYYGSRTPVGEEEDDAAYSRPRPPPLTPGASSPSDIPEPPELARSESLVKEVWKFDAASLSTAAWQRISEEWDEIRAMVNEDVEVERDPDNLSYWFVTLKKMPTDNPSGRHLANDLQQHKERFPSADGYIHLEVGFPPDYPNAPPRVILRSPMLLNHTGGITNGVFVGLPVLLKGWFPSLKLYQIIPLVQHYLVHREARVDMRTSNPYPTVAIRAAYQRITENMKEEAFGGVLPHANPVDKTLFAYSLEYLDSIGLPELPSIPQNFEKGNRVLLPHKVFQDIQGNLRSSRMESDHLSGKPMQFEITNHLGLRSYCGVMDFTAPDNMIVVPTWLRKNMQIDEGTEVHIRRVELLQPRFVRIQPHSREFSDISKVMGIDPKLYLEEALRGYTTLAVGDVIELSFEGRDFSFNVTDIRPHVPAVSIWGVKFGARVPVAFDTPLDILVEREIVPETEETKEAARRSRKATAAKRKAAILGRKAMNESAAAFFRQEEEKKAEKETQLEFDGVRIDGFDESKPRVTVKVRLTSALANMPPSVKIHCNNTTTAAELYDFVASSYCPVNIPIEIGLQLPGGDGMRVIEPDGTPLGAMDVHGKALDQRVKPATYCLLCQQLNQSDGVPPVRTYLLNEATVGVCEEHRLHWFEELLENRGLSEEDLRKITPDFLCESFNAELL